MMSISSVGVNTLRVVRQAFATRLAENNTATAMAVPHVQTLDMVEIVSSERSSAITVVMPTASPVCMSMGFETRKNGATLPIR